MRIPPLSALSRINPRWLLATTLAIFVLAAALAWHMEQNRPALPPPLPIPEIPLIAAAKYQPAPPANRTTPDAPRTNPFQSPVLEALLEQRLQQLAAPPEPEPLPEPEPMPEPEPVPEPEPEPVFVRLLYKGKLDWPGGTPQALIANQDESTQRFIPIGASFGPFTLSTIESGRIELSLEQQSFWLNFGEEKEIQLP